MKRGTHWKPESPLAQERREPLRPVPTLSTQIARLEGRKQDLEKTLRERFQVARMLGVEPVVGDLSRRLRAIKRELKDLRAKEEGR